jgi:hypothetical protein
MKIYEHKDAEGRVVSFEIDNLLISRRGVVRILRSIPDIHIIRSPRLLWWREDEFCEFEIGGQRFKALEPFGDNSRYWIGPEPPQWSEHIQLVQNAFARYGAKDVFKPILR